MSLCSLLQIPDINLSIFEEHDQDIVSMIAINAWMSFVAAVNISHCKTNQSAYQQSLHPNK